MKNRLQKLPIDHSSFEIIREDGLLYVDKTFYIHQMLEEGRYFFMARPRRFGKSLMVSALKCFFGNRKELFDGLWIAGNGDWEWAEYPVISFDFNEIGHHTPDIFETDLERNLSVTAQHYDVSLEAPSLKGKFGELLRDLRQKTGKPVIILIDEYDKPIIDHLGKGPEGMETAKANRDILKYFLGTMKGGDTVPSDIRRRKLKTVSRNTFGNWQRKAVCPNPIHWRNFAAIMTDTAFPKKRYMFTIPFPYSGPSVIWN